MAASDPITAALNIGTQLIDRLFPDPAQADEARLKLLALQQAGELAQIGVNTEEAKSASLLVSGWRPATGWVCVSACAWNWVLLPAITTGFAIVGHPIPTGVSPADLSQMLPVLLGMLGLGALRTVERLNNKA